MKPKIDHIQSDLEIILSFHHVRVWTYQSLFRVSCSFRAFRFVCPWCHEHFRIENVCGHQISLLRLARHIMCMPFTQPLDTFVFWNCSNFCLWMGDLFLVEFVNLSTGRQVGRRQFKGISNSPSTELNCNSKSDLKQKISGSAWRQPDRSTGEHADPSERAIPCLASACADVIASIVITDYHKWHHQKHVRTTQCVRAQIQRMFSVNVNNR